MHTVFTPAEVAYLQSGPGLGRLSTIAPDGSLHVVPVGWRYDLDHGVIEIGGRDAAEFVATRKYRNARANPKVGFVVDDVLPPWQPRAVSISGSAETIDAASGTASRRAVIRITPTQIRSWGLQPATSPQPERPPRG